MHSRISTADNREATCVRFGPMAAPSEPILWQPVQPAPPSAAARADGPLPFFVGQEIRGPRAEAVTGGAAARAVIELVTGADKLFRCDVRTQGQRARHFGLHLGNLVRDQRVERERPEHDAEDAEIIGPHAAPPPSTARTWTSRQVPRARR